MLMPMVPITCLGMGVDNGLVQMGIAFIEPQGNAANHQGTGCNQIAAECFVEDEHRETCSNKGSRRTNHWIRVGMALWPRMMLSSG